MGRVFDITIEGATITAITPRPDAHPRGMVLPALVDLHVHLDKTYTVDATGPANGHLFKAIELMAQHKQHWTPADLQARMSRALDEAWRAGTRALRSHIDWMITERPMALDVLLELKARWAGRLDLQWVSLSSIDQFGSASEADSIARQVAAAGGILGGFIYRNDGLEPKIRHLLAAARAHGLEVDFHVDEGLDVEANGLTHIARLVPEYGLQGRVTCGHVCSLSVQAPALAHATLRAVAQAGIRLVTLPVANLYLQGSWDGTPVERGITRVREAREAGVAISLANDNVADVFVPFGSYELLDAWALGVQMAHLPEPEDWLDMITTTPASVMGLPWDGRLSPGCPADLLWLPATNGLQLITPAGRRGRVCRAGHWIDAG